MAAKGKLKVRRLQELHNLLEIDTDTILLPDVQKRICTIFKTNIGFFQFQSIPGGKEIRESSRLIINDKWNNIAILCDLENPRAYGWIIPSKKSTLPLLNHSYCLKCWLWFNKKDFIKHCKQCLVCRCGQRYKQGDDHASHCTKAYRFGKGTKWEKDQSKIYESKEASIVFTLENNHFADFEAFPNNRMKYEVYAAVLVTDKMKGKEYWYAIGQNTMELFIEEQLMNLKGNLYFFYGSRFDAHFLLKHLLKTGHYILPESLLKTGSNILSFVLKTNVGELQVKDLNRFTPGSLEANCKAYGLKIEMSKGTFDHSKIRNWEDVEQHRQEIREYVSMDGVCMREIFNAYSKVIFDTYRMLPGDYMTASHLSYACWSSSITKTQQESLKRTPMNYSKNIRQFYRGGRIVCGRPKWESKQYREILAIHLNGKTIDKELYEAITDYAVYGDVNSLYPSTMINRGFPVGKPWFARVNSNDSAQQNRFISGITHGDEWQRGAYEVTVICPKNLNVPFLMERNDKGEVIQTLLDKKGWWTGPELKESLNLGYQIKMVHSVFLWSGTSDLFTNFVEKAYEIKNSQPKDTPLYNMAKSILNDLTGKFAQRSFEQQSLLIHPEEINKKATNNKNINCMNEITDEYGNVLALVIDKKVDKKYEEFSTWLTCFILGQSKVTMSQWMTAMNIQTDTEYAPYYGDTDSLIVNIIAWNRMPDNWIQTKKRELGRVKNEIEKSKILAVYVIGPKCYCVIYVTEDGQILCRIRCKGFPHNFHDYPAFEKKPALDQDRARQLYLDVTKKEAPTHYNYIDIKERVYIFHDLESKEYFFLQRIPADYFLDVLEGRKTLQAIFGSMLRVFDMNSKWEIGPHWRMRQLGKVNWWHCGKRIIREQADEFETSYPPGHEKIKS